MKGNIKKLNGAHIKYGLKIYREVWKFESGKVWNFEMEMCRNPVN